MKVIILLLMLLCHFGGHLSAQERKLVFSAGPELSFRNKDFPVYGIGINGGFETYLKTRVAATFDAGCNYFSRVAATYDYYIDESGPEFAIIPVLAGIKYYFIKKHYVSAKAGAVIGLLNSNTFFALSPRAGTVFKLTKRSKMDIGLKWLVVPRANSSPVNPFTFRGGYNFFSLKAAYIF